MNAPAIEISGLTKCYGEVQAVAGVSFTIASGRLFGLLGHNGAGKSTLIKLMLGLIRPDAGSVHILGQPISGPRFRDTRRHIGYLPENVSFYDNLSGAETLRFYAELKGVDTGACAALLQKVGIGHAAHRLVRHYSKGMRQRLGFAQALLGEPRVLFLDEPASGLDPEGVREFYELLARMRELGATIVLSSHNLAQIQDRVDEVALLRNGVLQAVGSVAALRTSLNLPVTIRLGAGAGSHASIRELLAPVDGCAIGTDSTGDLLISCVQAGKLTILSRLLGSGLTLTDLSIREPSLEEVFLEYSGGARKVVADA